MRGGLDDWEPWAAVCVRLCLPAIDPGAAARMLPARPAPMKRLPLSPTCPMQTMLLAIGSVAMNYLYTAFTV